MNVHKWNRKDALPEHTIEKFESILRELGIDICVVQEEGYKGQWYSNRIEIKGLSTIGTNGKGVTREYTLASALGEFFERLQSGALTNYLFLLKEPCVPSCILTEASTVDGFKMFFNSVYKDLQDDTADEIIFLNAKQKGTCISEDIRKGTRYLLPENLISILCGTNGLSAGNTYAEAFVQGISEVFERYVIQYIYTQEYENAFSILDDEVCKNLNSYKLIQSIRDKKYYVNIIDCSLNGLLPVIGVLVFDPSMTKYYFKLGSDANVDIALQRCITEIFQGVSFDLNFKMRMNDFFETSMEEQGFWFGSNRIYEHTRAEIDGTGKLPRGFFKSLKNISKSIRGFMENPTTNEAAAEFMLDCCSKISETIALVNYTKWGIPCLRIIIPDICTSFYYPGGKISVDQVLNRIQRFRNLTQQNQALSIEALQCMIDILNYPAYTYEFNMVKLLGVITNSISDAPYLYNPFLFTAYLALYLRKFDLAAYYMRLYNNSARIPNRLANLSLFIIKALKEGVTVNDIIAYVEIIHGNEIFKKEALLLTDVYTNGFDMPKCPDCMHCKLSHCCKYQSWKSIKDTMQHAKVVDCHEEFDRFMLSLRNYLGKR